MPRKSKRPKWYDADHLRKDYPDALYYMIIGRRSNGKTYSALKGALNRYFKYGEQFAYVRRYNMDILRKNLSELFAAHINDGTVATGTDGTWNTIYYGGSKFYLARYDEDSGKIIKEDNPCGFAFDLNSMEHHKSVSYPNVTTVIFDEFLSRTGYLTNEFVLFMNTISTIVRHRNNVKIFMLGNTVNQYCPYFAEMGLTHIKDQKMGTIDVYNYSDTGLQVVVEYCSGVDKGESVDSDAYFAFDNPQLQMITTGTWEIAVYPHLEKKYRPKDVVTNFFIDFNTDIIHGEIVVTDVDYYIFFHRKTTPIKDIENDRVYNTIPSQQWNYATGFNPNDKLSKVILSLIADNRVFYSDNEVGEVIRNYIQWSKSYNATGGN